MARPEAASTGLGMASYAIYYSRDGLGQGFHREEGPWSAVSNTFLIRVPVWRYVVVPTCSRYRRRGEYVDASGCQSGRLCDRTGRPAVFWESTDWNMEWYELSTCLYPKADERISRVCLLSGRLCLHVYWCSDHDGVQRGREEARDL
jgi:hypothetical protein